MAKARRQQDKKEPLTLEQWPAGLRERYRPAVTKLIAVFDNMPRRADEDEWRAALVEELLDLLEAEMQSLWDLQPDLDGVERRLFATLLALQARVKQAVEERRREAPES